VSKAAMLERLRVELGVPTTETLAIGDGVNDLEMLAWAADGVAMGHSPAPVRFDGSPEPRVVAAYGRGRIDRLGAPPCEGKPCPQPSLMGSNDTCLANALGCSRSKTPDRIQSKAGISVRGPDRPAGTARLPKPTRLERPLGPTDVPDDLSQLALIAARAGAAAIVAVMRTGPLNPAFKSGSHDMVTAADRAAEQAVIETIRAVRPEDPILGEEGGSLPGTTNVQWLVDPLDGTANFVYGRADYAVSVGVRVDREPVAGAIVRPGHRQWLAGDWRGVVAGRGGEDGEPLTFSQRATDLSAALVALGMPYDLQARRRVLAFAGALAEHARGIRVMGCAAGDLAAVTLGEVDVVLGFGLAEWDVAGGEAIVLAAGGRVRRIDCFATGLPAMISGPAELVDTLEAVVVDRHLGLDPM
jgi:myo-inositol-1(or 4)-monophosphatase